MWHHASGHSYHYGRAALLALAVALLGLPAGCGLKGSPTPPPGAIEPFPFP